MLDALAARLEDFEFVFVVAVEVIVERFAADCTRNGLVSVLTFEQYNHTHWIIVCMGIVKNQNAFVKHTEHPEDIGDCRQLDVPLAALEVRDCRRADTRQLTEPLLRQLLAFPPLLRFFDNSGPVDAKLPFHLFSILCCNRLRKAVGPMSDFSSAANVVGRRLPN